MIKYVSIQWKIPAQLCFSGQAQVAQKFWLIKFISIQWKIPGQLCFSGQAQVAPKSWIAKIYSVLWIQGTLFFRAKFQRNSVFQGKRKFLKNSECKKYIPYSENSRATLLFSGQPLVAQKSWLIKYISIQWKIPGQFCFSGQAQVAQKSWIVKNIFSTVNSGHPLFFRASASCSKLLNPKVDSLQWKFSEQLCYFQGKRKLLQNRELRKNFQYSVYSFGDDPCNLGYFSV